MADERIEDITGGAIAVLAAGDMFVALDVSDTTDDAQGTAKNVLASVIATYISNNLTIANDAAFRVVTAVGDGTLNAEAGLTFNGLELVNNGGLVVNELGGTASSDDFRVEAGTRNAVLYVNAANRNVGIGGNSTDYDSVNYQFHHHRGASGATAASTANKIVWEDDQTLWGMSFLGPTDRITRLNFGDSASNSQGQIRVDHADRSFRIACNYFDVGKATTVAATLQVDPREATHDAVIIKSLLSHSGNLLAVDTSADGGSATQFLITSAGIPVMTTPQINDTSADHQYIFGVSELVADRTVTLPLLTGNDTFVFEAHTATLTNKTLDLANNTVTGTKAEFDTAVSDGNIAYDGGAHHDGFSDFVANEHVDHTAVTITVAATTNETSVAEGAQDISASRTFTVGIADNPVMPGTARVGIPVGTTAQRPGVPADGDLRINTTDGTTEIYRDASWRDLEAGTGMAPTNAQYVTLATDATLTDERVLTGTSNQITITDNGAGSTVVLSAPQDIHTGAAPTFATLNLTGDSNQIVLDSDAGGGVTTTITDSATAARTITLPDATDTLVGKDTTDTLTNKSIDLANNTLTGTKAEFDTAVSDGNIAYDGGAHHDGFSDFVANEHVDHTAVTITVAATTNETSVAEGAQDISASRTFTVGIADDPVIPGTARLGIPVGTTAQRPGAPADGDLRVNTTDGTTEIYRSAAWRDLEAGGGGGAPTNAQYVTLATDATLTDERVLTGTANQITVTDNGAGSTVVLSTPQDLHTAASVTFGALDITNDIDCDGHIHLGTALVTKTISANAVTVDLTEANHQKVDLTAATDAVTVTIDQATGPCGGSLLFLQDNPARDITWTAGTGITSIIWMHTEPTWANDPVSSRRLISFFFDNTDLYLVASNPEGTGGTGDMLASTYDPASVSEQLVGLTATQTLTNKTLTSPVLTLPQINDTSADHQYVFAVSELAADRTVTLPLLTGNDTFVFNAFAATLTNKTINLANNTVTGTKAEFDTAVSDGNIAYDGGAHHDGFSDFVANEHIDHTAVTITVSGTANQVNVAEGAQDISASRTFTLSTPQDIDTGANIQFDTLGLGEAAAATTPKLTMTTGATTSKGVVIKSVASQSANLFEVDSSASGGKAAASGFGPNGRLFASLGSSDTNFFVGPSVANFTLSGTNNFGAGKEALSALTSAGNCTAIGRSALKNLQTGDNNMAIGDQAGLDLNGGTLCTLIGKDAGLRLVTSTNCIYIGGRTSNVTASPSNSVGIGVRALNEESGSQNVGIGLEAGRDLTTGTDNCFIGYQAGRVTGTGITRSVFIGTRAGNTVTSNQCIFIGYQTGNAHTSGSRNIGIGYDLDMPSNTTANQLSIGNIIFGTDVDGTGTTISTGNVGIAVSDPDAKLEVAGEGHFQGTVSFDLVNNVISANAATIDLSAGNHQSLDLAAATGAVTVTLTAPLASTAAAGTLIIKQDTTARDITWVSGTGITLGRWLGTEPTWSSDTPSLYRRVNWMFDGTDVFLDVTSEQTATF